MMGVFGGYTRWAVVFLIIFVLFFLLCPATGYAQGPMTKTVSMTEYGMTGYDPSGTGTYGNYMGHSYGESSSSL